MADRLWRAQVTIPLDSLVPEDAIVNTFHFDDDDDPVAAPDDTEGWIMQLLTAFYQSFDQLLFPNTVASPAVVKMYDMAELEPRQQVGGGTIPLTPSAADPYPGEVALCLSFAAAQESGVNPARRRGRLYLGPVANDVYVVAASQARPAQTLVDLIVGAADTLQAGLEHPASPGFRLRWSVYSPTTRAGGGTVGDSFNDVLTGWVDDAWDTQRRRGPKPSQRTTFS